MREKRRAACARATTCPSAVTGPSLATVASNSLTLNDTHWPHPHSHRDSCAISSPALDAKSEATCLISADVSAGGGLLVTCLDEIARTFLEEVCRLLVRLSGGIVGALARSFAAWAACSACSGKGPRMEQRLASNCRAAGHRICGPPTGFLSSHASLLGGFLRVAHA